MCMLDSPAPDFPPTNGDLCCIGSAVYGPRRCTCWEPVYDLDQTQPDTTVGGEPNIRRRMCDECAYRPNSPERNGDPQFVGDAEFLEQLAADPSRRFWCHQGMRKVIAWRHPSGMEIPDRPGASYDPPSIDGVPYLANGRPGQLCAGWDARRRELAGSDAHRP
jgi:hypothetical protein